MNTWSWRWWQICPMWPLRWIHIKCGKINHQKYEKLKKDPLAWYSKSTFWSVRKSISCDHYGIDDLNKSVINQSDLTVIHQNISSLALHIDKLKLILSLSRITKNNSLVTNINISDYNFKHTLTESKESGLLMYISNQISYKLCNDLNIYCSKQLESVFIENLIPNKQNQLIGNISQ